jgi:ferritin-like metal-binding protein YciE
MASMYANNAERQRAYRERYRNRIENRIETTEEQIARLTEMIADLTQLLQGIGKWETSDRGGQHEHHG